MARKPSKNRPAADRGVPVSGYTPPPWQQTAGMFLAGREAIDAANYLHEQMEAKWGCGRLRLLVDADLRNKLDRQRYLFLQAVEGGQLIDVQREGRRMCSAWKALDKAAAAAGASPQDPAVWELVVPFGIFKGLVVAIVKDDRDVAKVKAEGRHTIVYGLDEIGRLIAADHFSLTCKENFHGAEVVPAKKPMDPVRPRLFEEEDGIVDIMAPIDDVMGFDRNRINDTKLDDPIPF
jgi:hypothetical protein